MACLFFIAIAAGSCAGYYFGSEIRIARDNALGVSWKEPVFTNLEIGGFLAGGALVTMTGLVIVAFRQRGRRP